MSPHTDFQRACGYHAKKEWKAALKFFLKAAAHGHVEAQAYAGNIYHVGGHGVVRDLVQAKTWYLKAALHGHKTAQHCIGVFYQDGEGGVA